MDKYIVRMKSKVSGETYTATEVMTDDEDCIEGVSWRGSKDDFHTPYQMSGEEVQGILRYLSKFTWIVDYDNITIETVAHKHIFKCETCGKTLSVPKADC
jgi:hypothetical protein